MYVYIIIIYTIPFLPDTGTLIFQADSYDARFDIV